MIGVFSRSLSFSFGPFSTFEPRTAGLLLASLSGASQLFCLRVCCSSRQLRAPCRSFESTLGSVQMCPPRQSDGRFSQLLASLVCTTRQRLLDLACPAQGRPMLTRHIHMTWQTSRGMCLSHAEVRSASSFMHRLHRIPTNPPHARGWITGEFNCRLRFDARHLVLALKNKAIYVSYAKATHTEEPCTETPSTAAVSTNAASHKPVTVSVRLCMNGEFRCPPRLCTHREAVPPSSALPLSLPSCAGTRLMQRVACQTKANLGLLGIFIAVSLI